MVQPVIRETATESVKIVVPFPQRIEQTVEVSDFDTRRCRQLLNPRKKFWLDRSLTLCRDGTQEKRAWLAETARVSCDASGHP